MKVVTSLACTWLCLSVMAQAPSDSLLRHWVQGFRTHYYSDTAKSNAYVDSIKTQLVDKTDTALYWEAQYLGYSAYIDARTTDFERMLPKLIKARKLLLQVGTEREVQDLNSRIGTAYVTAKTYDSALVYVKMALEGNQKLGNEPRVNRVLGDLFIIYFYKGEYEQALNYILEHVEKSLQLSDTTILPQAYTNLAATYFRLSEVDSSYKYHLKSLYWSQFRGAPIDLGYCYLNLGEIHSTLGDLDSALFYHQKAQEAFESIDFKTGLTSNSLNLGKLYQKVGSISQALQYTQESAQMAEIIGDLALLRDALELEVSLHKIREDYYSALTTSERAKVIQDSLDAQLNKQEMDDLITQYETREKQQQIDLQNSQLAEQKRTLQLNRLLLIGAILIILMLVTIGMLLSNRMKKKQEAQLQAERLYAREMEIKATVASQEKERARYARDLHDGFGQMISLLTMNLKNLGTNSKPDERQKVFESSELLLQDMYEELKRICFDLMPHTLVQAGLTAAIDEFATRVNQSGQLHIERNYFGLEDRLIDVQEIAFYRIVQEWINNIIKHSDASKVTVQLTRDKQEITLLIEDNGSKIDQHRLIHGSGNGWKNLQARTNLIKGVLELESAELRGNTLILNAPGELSPESTPQNTLSTV